MAFVRPPRSLLQLAAIAFLVFSPLVLLLLSQPSAPTADSQPSAPTEDSQPSAPSTVAPSTVAPSTDSETCPLKCKCSTVKRKHDASRKQVDCTKAGYFSVPSGIPDDTQILILNRNGISRIHGELANLSQLQELQIVDNKLEKIESGDLTGLISLELLYLTRNQLTDWPDLCNDAGSSLKHLGLDENKLTGTPAPPTYANCTALLSLILTKNTFPSLTNATLAALGQAGSLRSVKMNFVKLKAVDPTAFVPVAESLTNLDLGDNSDLPADHLVAAFSAVTFTNRFVGLTLKSTGWKELPSGFLPAGHFPSLDILHLDGSNKLASLKSDALAGGSSLTHLFLNECPLLTSLDSQLTGLSKLTDLSLARTGLSSWTAATFGPSLLRLDLSNAGIESLGGADGQSLNPLPGLASLADAGLRIGGNPLVCNCSLLWLTRQLSSDVLRKKFYKLDEVMCHNQNSSGALIKLTDCKPLNCNSSSTTTTFSTTTTTTSTTTVSTSTTTTMKPTTPAYTAAGNSTATPSIPASSAPPVRVLPVLIAGIIVGALLLTSSLLLLVRKLRLMRQQQRPSLNGDREQRQSLVSGLDEENGSSDCFKLMRRRPHNNLGESASTPGAAEDPDYRDAVA